MEREHGNIRAMHPWSVGREGKEDRSGRLLTDEGCLTLRRNGRARQVEPSEPMQSHREPGVNTRLRVNLKGIARQCKTGDKGASHSSESHEEDDLVSAFSISFGPGQDRSHLERREEGVGRTTVLYFCTGGSSVRYNLQVHRRSTSVRTCHVRNVCTPTDGRRRTKERVQASRIPPLLLLASMEGGREGGSIDGWIPSKSTGHVQRQRLTSMGSTCANHFRSNSWLNTTSSEVATCSLLSTIPWSSSLS